MTVGALIATFNFAAALAAFAAAFLWHRSATVKVTYQDKPDHSGMRSAAIITDENTDFVETVAEQSRWSKRGAYAAGAAAALQGIALLLQGLNG